MSQNDCQRWDLKYEAQAVPERLTPNPWLCEVLAGVEPRRALELACGLGHNAIWLAEQGWTVDAVDISPAGLRLAEQLARRFNQSVNWITADLDTFTPEPEAYDLVVICRFLDRRLLPDFIQKALCGGGMLVYETFTASQMTRPDNHLKNPAFALESGELPRIFSGWDIISRAEVSLPDANMARFVARKPLDGVQPSGCKPRPQPH